MKVYDYQKWCAKKWNKKYPEAFYNGGFGPNIRRGEQYDYVLKEINDGLTRETKLNKVFWPAGVKYYCFTSDYRDRDYPKTIGELIDLPANWFIKKQNYGKKTLRNLERFLNLFDLNTKWFGPVEPIKIKRLAVVCSKCNHMELLKEAIVTRVFI